MLGFQRLTGLMNSSAQYGILKCMSRIWGSKYLPEPSHLLVVPTNQQEQGASSTPLSQRLLLKPALNKPKALNWMELSASGLNRGATPTVLFDNCLLLLETLLFKVSSNVGRENRTNFSWTFPL